MKDPEYVTKIMESWTVIDELVGATIGIDFIEISGTNDEKKFTYQDSFGIYFKYRNQVDNHKNWRHAPISLERTWVT